MKIAVFSCKPYDKRTLENVAESESGIEFHFFESRLSLETMTLAKGFDGVSCFVNDDLNRDVILELAALNIKCIALRCAGYNNVDLVSARANGISVFHVPDYSPTSVAEHAVALILALNRKTHRAYNRVKDNNFALEGLLGFNLEGKTVACIGTGRIGQAFCRIMKGFGCHVLCYDISPNDQLIEMGCEYTDLHDIYRKADIISLHCPLNASTHHLINERTLKEMKDGIMIINTSRGALVNAQEAIDNIYTGKIGYLGLDVYEQEGNIFFEDMSDHIVYDSVFQLLLTFPNVIVTGHQGYFTDIALQHIAETTLNNLISFKNGVPIPDHTL
ncbi:2-hydroxyacid dehydrogenase [Marinomonas mediterranea]|jgi:Lactate dehydrogenase and related dehydrogenases|uniref:D-lactate dehydrogenase n=1 Tax=Marinomonas mediterranea (strain ATCC 700492 / JCM 21426 / NBRC 103028 / MMB-1) TaxID=717774 RepID=F2K1H8_MARM1|nr:2-hydroxyacid dehydrogenase [Marinomonas mediterranea]ADZ92208.1 D-lactate dehydrogenase [Marinomonas mediterranea MMB-1]WCN10168.1 2-hydroxyacid dehydrogenase [Marinomonas mediterranea]WCN14213.1 2-hydroxyacid dehydrogenase [Marinomonas mediterranea]WCN18269.1 2-hydroxyacid dehydrogenase [Marinomonas mediterranea MMB-1]